MFYAEKLRVETTHLTNAPLEERIKCWAGVIHHVGIIARPGTDAKIRVAFFRGGHRIYPAGNTEYFVPSEHPLRFKDFLILSPGENEIVVKLWNVDAKYYHEIIIELGILPEDEISVSKALIMLSETLQYLGDKIRTYF